MKFSSKKFFLSSFVALNVTQFLTALNDNLYKLALIFFLISLKGPEHSNTILALAGAVFVIPFILFASLSGTLADRFSKRTIIYVTRITEILTTTLGLSAFYFHSAWGGYVVLFLMAVQSTLFSPCKYGIIPEIVPKSKISQCNGVITSTTYLAIILGTFLASFLTEITNQNFVFLGSVCLLVSIVGWFVSQYIEKTAPQDENKRLSFRFISEIYKILKNAKKRRYLFATLIFGAYFLFMGSYTQLNIIPFALQSLHLSDVYGGYLFLMTAIGIGIGSYFSGRLSGKEVELGFVPLAALGIMLCFLSLYFFQHLFFAVAPILILLGLFGGFYTVPIDAFIQVASPDKDRGQNVAAGNFLSFLGVILASGCLAFFGNALELTAAQGFLNMGLITLILGIVLLFVFADQVLRLLVAGWARFFLKIRISGRKQLQEEAVQVLIAPHSSWIDTIIVMATLPRMIRYIIPITEKKRKFSLLYKLLWLVPIDIAHFGPIGPPPVSAILKELNSGNSVCLMQPTSLPESLADWQKMLQASLQKFHFSIVPITISKSTISESANPISQLLGLRQNLIRVSYGPPIKL